MLFGGNHPGLFLFDCLMIWLNLTMQIRPIYIYIYIDS